MQALIKQYEHLLVLHTSTSEDIEMCKSQRKELASKVRGIDRSDIILLKTLDEILKEENYIRKGSRYFNQDNGHRVRFNTFVRYSKYTSLLRERGVEATTIPNYSQIFNFKSSEFETVTDIMNMINDNYYFEKVLNSRLSKISYKLGRIAEVLKFEIREKITSSLFEDDFDEISFIPKVDTKNFNFFKEYESKIQLLVENCEFKFGYYNRTDIKINGIEVSDKRKFIHKLFNTAKDLEFKKIIWFFNSSDILDIELKNLLKSL